jgi:hypothetical protein|tara:strand:+ start:984 stop:1562 length:579 start_codon:yes stop_codon:yes gene_type:complete
MSNSPKIIENFLPDAMFANFAYRVIDRPHFSVADYTADIRESDGSIETLGRELNPNVNFNECMAQSIIYRRRNDQITFLDFYIEADPVIQKIHNLLNIKKLWMMRVNCTFGTKEPHQGAFHRDMVGTYFDKHGKIAILYLNSNNGGTQFKDGEFIKSEANRCVVAPSSAEHAGVWATDSKCRFVLNLNYEEK